MVDYLRLKNHKKAYFAISVLIKKKLASFKHSFLLKELERFPNQIDYFKVGNFCTTSINIMI